MKNATIIGIDIAKNVFHLCVMNGSGRVLARRKLSRGQLFEYVTTHWQGVIAMECCGGSHYWARRFEAAGFETRQIPAQFVKPFVKSNKNDRVDAEAICEAALRPQMRFVATKREEQQDIQNVHRVRERLVSQRTALCNEIRGLLLEYGIVIGQGISKLRTTLPTLLERESPARSALWNQTFRELYDELCLLDNRINLLERQLRGIATADKRCRNLMQIPGVGPISATAVIAAVGNPKDFSNARQFAAWMGLTPRQHATGGKQRLGRISKRGNGYLRRLLVQGASSAGLAAMRKQKSDRLSEWFLALQHRRGYKRAIVALANKLARRIWAVLVCGAYQELPAPIASA